MEQIDIAHTYSQIFVDCAGENLAKAINKPAGSPLLHLVETYKTRQGLPVVHTFNYFDTDVLNFFIVRRVVPLDEFNRRKINEDE